MGGNGFLLANSARLLPSPEVALFFPAGWAAFSIRGPLSCLIDMACSEDREAGGRGYRRMVENPLLHPGDGTLHSGDTQLPWRLSVPDTATLWALRDGQQGADLLLVFVGWLEACLKPQLTVHLLGLKRSKKPWLLAAPPSTWRVRHLSFSAAFFLTRACLALKVLSHLLLSPPASPPCQLSHDMSRPARLKIQTLTPTSSLFHNLKAVSFFLLHLSFGLS